MSENQKKPQGHQKLVEILSDALAGGADSVTLEYEGGGDLEVMFNSGKTGVGFLLDGEWGEEMIRSLYQEKKKLHGKIRLALHGKDYFVKVKTYDSFGETAYQLTLRRAKH